MKRITSVLSLCLCAGAFAPAFGQFFAASFGGGPTVPVYNAGRRFDNGWNVGAGAGIRPIPWIGVMLDFGYNQMDANKATLNSLHFSSGQMRIFSFTVDPVIHLNPHGPVGIYLIGGAGVYHRTIEFTQPAAGAFTGFDPFFGPVTGSESTVKGGANGGAGIEIGFSHHIKAFAEARYHNMYTQGRNTTYLPVTVGFRW